MCESKENSISVFFGGRNFAKFQPEKSDFDLFKGFFMEKIGPNSPDFRNKLKIQTARFLLWFQSSRYPRIYVEGFWFFSYFICI